MEQKNFKKCHSRNLEQTDLILDFLSTLDKSKNSFTWQDEINQINQDWCKMMNSSEDEDEYSKEEASEDRVDSKQEPLTPSKKVTWSHKLTAVKNISPQHHHHHGGSVKPFRGDTHHGDATVKLKSPPKYYHQQNFHHHHHHHHHHQHSPRKSGAKVRLISFHPNTL